MPAIRSAEPASAGRDEFSMVPVDEPRDGPLWCAMVNPDGQLAGHFICPTGRIVYFD